MRKRIIALAATTLFSSMLFVGCGGSKGSYSLTEKNIIEGALEYQIRNIELTDRVDPSNPKDEYKFFKPSGADNVLINIEVEVKNLKSTEVNAKELLDSKVGTVKMMEGNKLIEDANGSNLKNTDTEMIAPNEKRIMHFLYEVAPKIVDTKINLEMIADGKSSTQKVDFKSLNYEKKEVALGESITVEGFGEAKIISIEDKEKLEPSNPQGAFNYYYPSKEGDILRVITAEFQNLSDKEISADEAIGTRTQLVDDVKYGRVLVETEDGKNIAYGNTVKIAPNSKVKLYIITEITKLQKSEEVKYKISMNCEKFNLKK